MRAFCAAGFGAVTALSPPTGLPARSTDLPHGTAFLAVRFGPRTAGSIGPAISLPEAGPWTLAGPTARQGMGVCGCCPVTGDMNTLTTIHEEARVLDTDLAKALGMAEPGSSGPTSASRTRPSWRASSV